VSAIEKYNMINKNDIIIVGVSGGADSISLIHILNKLKTKYNTTLIAVHVNHCIRKEEAKRDEQYTIDFCNNINIKTEIFSFDIKKIAKQLLITEEEAGRLKRYEAFEKTLKKYNADKIAVAHNMNDNAETLLMRLFRGTGIKGLGGISPVRGNIIRPLIFLTRSEIEKYCNDNNINFKIDSTNEKDIYSRNKIRLKLIPWICENFNKNIINTLSKTSLIMSQENEYLDNIAKQALEECAINSEKTLLDINKLKEYDDVIKRRIIRQAYLKYTKDLHDISYQHINMILDLLYKQTGKSINLPYGLKAEIQYNNLLLYKQNKDENGFCYDVKEETVIYIKQINKYIKISKYKKINLPGILPYTISFNYDKIINALKLRTRLSGDRIYYNGIGGNKKIKNLFIDLKIPRIQRDNIAMLADGNNILWIDKYKISDFYKADKNTNNKIYLHIWEANKYE